MSRLTKFITTAALLTAIAIIIPLVVPLIQISPLLTFTLAVHVPIFIACFISPRMATAVAIGSTFGFALTKPLIVTARVATHIVFAVLAALYFKKHGISKNKWHLSIVAIVIGIIHALSEAVVMHIFFFQHEANPIFSIYLVLGAWMLLYSCVDFALALSIYKLLLNHRLINWLSENS